MKKKHVNVEDYAGAVMKALEHGGILLTTKAGEKVNSMVIGWGTIGINWARPVFVTYVREHRFTIEQLTKNPEFTVNIPLEGSLDPKIIKVCGAMSGRGTDKIAQAGLTTAEPEKISVPGIREAPLTLECKVIYRQNQEISLYNDEIMQYYPQDVDGSAVGANKDAHITFFGEIVDAYILED